MVEVRSSPSFTEDQARRRVSRRRRSFRLPADLDDDLIRFAEQTGRTKTAVVVDATRQMISATPSYPPSSNADGLDRPPALGSFWQRHKAYSDLHDAARSAGVDPWAGLGAFLAVRSAQMPPGLRLGPLNAAGRFTSLTLLVALTRPTHTERSLPSLSFAYRHASGFPVSEVSMAERSPSRGGDLGAAAECGNALAVIERPAISPGAPTSDALQFVTATWIRSTYLDVPLPPETVGGPPPNSYSLGVVLSCADLGGALADESGIWSRFLPFPDADPGDESANHHERRRGTHPTNERQARAPRPSLKISGEVLPCVGQVAARIQGMYLSHYAGDAGCASGALVRHKLAGLLGSLKAQWDARLWSGADLDDWEDAGMVLRFCDWVRSRGVWTP